MTSKDQNLIEQSRQGIELSKQLDNENQEKLTSHLIKIAALKGIELQENHLIVWIEKIKSDIECGEYEMSDINLGLKKLEQEKSYGGLDYGVFYSGIKEHKEKLFSILADEQWDNVLNFWITDSTPAARKALDSIGGSQAIRDANRSDIHWIKKEFINALRNFKDYKEDPQEEVEKEPEINASNVYAKTNTEEKRKPWSEIKEILTEVQKHE